MRCVWLGLVLGACGADVSRVDLEGIYQVGTAVGSEPCGLDNTVNAPAFVKFAESPAGGFRWSSCSDAAGVNCTMLGRVDLFDEPSDGGWANKDTYTGMTGDACFMGYFEMAATLDGDALTFERHIYEEQDVPAAQCTDAEALTRGMAMPCVEHALWMMTRSQQ